jgi:hypothetical protein
MEVNMAHAPNRSMNVELQEGLVDGRYKRFAPDRTNIQFPDESKIEMVRRDLYWPEGITEADTKYTPEGKAIRKEPRY